MSYEWSGCCSGSAPTASCSVSSLGENVCAVTVRDGHGGTASARGTATGTNRRPEPVLTYTGTFDPQVSGPPLASNKSAYVLGYVNDDDSMSRTCVSATATGACTAAKIADCTELAGIEIDFRTTAGPGTCTVSVTTRDPWGVTGTGSKAIEVKAP